MKTLITSTLIFLLFYINGKIYGFESPTFALIFTLVLSIKLIVWNSRKSTGNVRTEIKNNINEQLSNWDFRKN